MIDSTLKLFSGENSNAFARQIASLLGISVGEIYHHTFPIGEHYVQIKENIRGSDAFLIQSAYGKLDANNALMQLLIMADAAKRASAERITAVLPLFFYQRQDRKDKPRVPISAKLIMNLLEAAGIHRVITMDLHAQQIQGFTDLPVDHLYFQPTLMKALSGLNIEVVVAPDTGAIKKAVEFSEKAKLDFAFIVKKRKNDTDVEVTQFVGDVKGKNVLVLDDLTESAGTIIAAANCCKNNGAENVYGAVTHGCLSRIGASKLNIALQNGTIKRFFCSDTVTENTVDINNTTGGTIISVAEVFAAAINGTHYNKSITSLFQ